MEPLYDLNKPDFGMKPEEYNVNYPMSLTLFPLPMEGAIGTNDLNDNAITSMIFKKGKIKYDTWFKRAVDDISGGGHVVSVVEEGLIGIAQARRFALFNFKTKYADDFFISRSIDDSIRKAFVADAKKRHFLFEIKRFDHNSQSTEDFTQLIWLMDLSGGRMQLLRELEKPYGLNWFVAQGKIFMYEMAREQQLRVFNMNFQPVYHPLVDFFKRHKGKDEVEMIYIHPSLPFAILEIYNKPTSVFYWGGGLRGDRQEELVPIARTVGEEFRFSPDGKWVVFNKKIELGRYATYLMPVSEKYPYYLGTPIELYDSRFDIEQSAWTTNPISFAGSRGRSLYRWELTKEARGIDDNKYPTYHDFIVTRDLEQLTKNKKQGLGKN